MSITVDVQAVKVPNPNAMKFNVAGRKLLVDSMMFANIGEATGVSPLAVRLLDLEAVKNVFINRDFITIQLKEELGVWGDFLGPIRGFLKSYLGDGAPVLEDGVEGTNGKEFEKDSLEFAFSQMLELKIMPATRHDGGEITLDYIKDGIAWVKLSGSCVACPFAPRTIKHGIEEMTKTHFSEIVEVSSHQVNWDELNKKKAR